MSRAGREHISSILARVFKHIEKIYGGEVPWDLAESPDLSDPPTLSGRERQIEGTNSESF